MKKLYIFLSLCLLCHKVPAQNKPSKRVTFFEMDIGFGLAYPLFDVNHFKKYMGNEPLKIIPGLNYEWGLRFNFPDRPHSIGAQYTLAISHKHRGELCEQGSLMNLEVFYDYNFKQGTWFNPFVGMGMGYSRPYYALVSIHDDVNTINYMPLAGGEYSAMCFTPRMGFELFKHIRFTLSMTYIDKKASFYGFTIGGVVGGGTKIAKP